MQINEHYSHLNGLEYLQVHLPGLWEEIASIVNSVTLGEFPVDASANELSLGFASHNWQSELIDAGSNPPYRVHLKDRVSVEVALAGVKSDILQWFYRHKALYSADVIDVGIEIVPMKSLQEQMPSGVPCFEGELYNLMREGRGVPAVPLVLIGLEA